MTQTSETTTQPAATETDEAGDNRSFMQRHANLLIKFAMMAVFSVIAYPLMIEAGLYWIFYLVVPAVLALAALHWYRSRQTPVHPGPYDKETKRHTDQPQYGKSVFWIPVITTVLVLVIVVLPIVAELFWIIVVTPETGLLASIGDLLRPWPVAALLAILTFLGLVWLRIKRDFAKKWDGVIYYPAILAIAALVYWLCNLGTIDGLITMTPVLITFGVGVAMIFATYRLAKLKTIFKTDDSGNELWFDVNDDQVDPREHDAARQLNLMFIVYTALLWLTMILITGWAIESVFG